MNPNQPEPAGGLLVTSSRQLGMWLFLATVTMLFAGVASAFLVSRALPDWQSIPFPQMLAVNTLILLVSSASLELAGRWKPGLALATLLGGGFLVGQVAVWRQLAAAGVYIPTSPYAAFLYLFTALHGVHLGGGFLFLAWLSLRVSRGGDFGPGGELLLLARTLWHFLTILWVLILGLLVVA